MIYLHIFLVKPTLVFADLPLKYALNEKKVVASKMSGAATFYLAMISIVKLLTEFNFLGFFISFNGNDVERKHC